MRPLALVESLTASLILTRICLTELKTPKMKLVQSKANELRVGGYQEDETSQTAVKGVLFVCFLLISVVLTATGISNGPPFSK